MANTKIALQFYTLKPLPVEMRAKFRLTTNPYHGQEAIEASGGIMDILGDYDPIYYRTDRPKDSRGVILHPNGFDPTEETGYHAYKYVLKAELANNALVPATWISGQKNKKYGDTLAWVVWGREHDIISVTPTVVQLAY